VKKPEAVMEILEAYDLTGSFRAAAGLVGCEGFYVKSGNGPGERTGEGPEGPSGPEFRKRQRGGCGLRHRAVVCGHSSTGRDVVGRGLERAPSGSVRPRCCLPRLAPGRPSGQGRRLAARCRSAGGPVLDRVGARREAGRD
jgi:hypothetical protein